MVDLINCCINTRINRLLCTLLLARIIINGFEIKWIRYCFIFIVIYFIYNLYTYYYTVLS